MRITSIEAFGLEAELAEPFGYSQAWVQQRRAVLVRARTADGQTGWGEVYVQAPPVIYTKLIAEYLAPMLLGEDPWNREALFARLYNRTLDSGQRGLILGGLSGLDIALWDLVGHDCGKPVHSLLGGLSREKVEAYATGLYRLPTDDWLARVQKEAEGYIEAGFSTMKTKVGYGFATDLAEVRALREAIGDRARLAVDANHAYRPAEAIRLGRMLEQYDIAWFEEPVSPEDLEGYAEVRRSQPIPVAGGEVAFSRFGFKALLDAKAVDILQPDLCLCGGLSEGRAIADLARAANTACWAHVWGTGIARAAALHYLGYLPNVTALADVSPILIEWDSTPNPLRDEVTASGPKVQGGFVRVQKTPGLGVEVDEDALSRYSVAYEKVEAR